MEAERVSGEVSALVDGVRTALGERGATINPPAKDADIRAAEDRLGIHLPPTLRLLYQIFDGARDPNDTSGWSFFSLAELETKRLCLETDQMTAGEKVLHLCFCDTLIWCPAYSVCVDPRFPASSEVWCVVSDDHVYPCSSSIERFLAVLPAGMDDIIIEDKEG